MTDIQIHQGFIKCETEIDKAKFEYNQEIGTVKEDIRKLKQPLETILQDLFKEKEMMERQMDRYAKKYRELSLQKETEFKSTLSFLSTIDDMMHKTHTFLNQSMLSPDTRDKGILSNINFSTLTV